ncbi:MAG: UDP-N-acetylglucosamine--N-acetylmuramyl-(pentapeptide) pyrophosphoryl-undecaprenol N-acetylglucosamine transferase [Treponema sp.]|jgi:UDP-N-acetylglucosamine--N-acetylmuramyl-(pentapeptide) pyrophosphoryl-undecaprenol N-acetylglucosamine transferase|nr:UDP-N-acetylglucosamine--N-acetylmuramyl-(pentapeptide) pyrophosphoryl-undecaprenol N-acetylglucosamine transferase [Treponema sp.]
MVNIAFTGGGTGGHIYPGLAVAAEIRRRFGGTGCRIFWIGSDRGRDRALVEGAGLDFFGVPAGKLRRYFSLKTVPDTVRVAAGFFAARAVLQTQKPDLLFSKGGFVSVPPCAAAASLGIPVFTHESDYSPGLATRLNLRFVRRTGGTCFISYGETAGFLPAAVRERTVVSGNPVRAVFREASPEQGRAFLGLGPAVRILLVLGGSQGASELNALVRSALPELCRRYTVVHQTGDPAWDVPAMDCYLHYPYIYDEMPHVLAAAELVLGRAGAGTVWESAALGKPMALLPLRGSGTRGDQVENARFFENAGAAVTLSETDANPETLAAVINGLADDPVRRNSMAAASLKTGKCDGAAIIGGFIGEFIKKKRPESGEA